MSLVMAFIGVAFVIVPGNQPLLYIIIIIIADNTYSFSSEILLI